MFKVTQQETKRARNQTQGYSQGKYWKPLDLKDVVAYWAWWHTSVIPATQEAEASFT
jgi:hypothetical protein